MDIYPLSVGISPSVLERWQGAEHEDWIASGQPRHHPYEILDRRSSVVHVECEDEALVVYESALVHTRWWERDIHPHTADSLRDFASQLVEATELWQHPRVIELWTAEVRRLTDVYMQHAVLWSIRAAALQQRLCSTEEFIVEQGIRVDAACEAENQVTPRTLKNIEGMENWRDWDVNLSFANRDMVHTVSQEAPTATDVLRGPIRWAWELALAPGFPSWRRAFGSSATEEVARAQYEFRVRERDWLRRFLGEERFLEAITRVMQDPEGGE